jgi:homogentisate 1,2-dioxygenase
MEALTWRHGVVLTKADGSSHPRTNRASDFAAGLLREWGSARGLTPLGELRVQSWDYGVVGYCMEFSGELVDSGTESRLVGYGRQFPQQVHGCEERYVVDRDLSKPTTAEMAYHGMKAMWT